MDAISTTTQACTFPYLILKYYHYTPIEDPPAFRLEHHRYCIKHHLRGRIKVAPEGINGTLAGLTVDCEQYMRDLKADPRFADIEFNSSPTTELAHHKLHVRLKSEILNTGLPPHIMPSQDHAKRYYIDTATFQQMRQQEDVVLVDVRSNYEHKIGQFERSLTFNINAFREFPPKARQMTWDKKKRYIVICTRGIKSEKARDFMRQELGLNALHLKGGILDHSQKGEGNGFQGACYVFDQRVHVTVNQRSPQPISQCHHCQQPSSRMVNCANDLCNAHLPICAPCTKRHQGACSVACQAHPNKRPYNERGYYPKQLNGYNPYIGLYR